jgi:hypothetical protein
MKWLRAETPRHRTACPNSRELHPRLNKQCVIEKTQAKM